MRCNQFTKHGSSFLSKCRGFALLLILFAYILPQSVLAFGEESLRAMTFPLDEEMTRQYRLIQAEKAKKYELEAKLHILKSLVKERYQVLTAYSSTPDQTDDSPFITASGTFVHDGIVAANSLPFGTKILMPELFGEKIFTVEDRMAQKNYHKIDVWFPSTDKAMNFGVKRAKILILSQQALNILESSQS